MPRNVRNFWIEAEVDGRKTPIAFGPVGKDGGFRLIVHMRDGGIVTTPLYVDGVAYQNLRGLGPRLALLISTPDGGIIWEHITQR